MKIKAKKTSYEDVSVEDSEILKYAISVIGKAFDIEGCFLDKEGFVAYDERNYEVQVRKANEKEIEAFKVTHYLHDLSILIKS